MFIGKTCKYITNANILSYDDVVKHDTTEDDVMKRYTVGEGVEKLDVLTKRHIYI